MAAEEQKPVVVEDEDDGVDYDTFMMGGVISNSYMGVQ